MNLLQIQYFVSVAKNMSFTQASRELYISQPSLSKQVAALEDELGVKLFIRTGKSLQLTTAGTFLYDDFKEVLANISNIVQRVNDIENAIDGRLKIGFPFYMDISRVTNGAIAEFHKTYPNIKLKFKTLLNSDLKREFCEGHLDCVFLFEIRANELIGTTPTKTLSIYNAPLRLVYPKSFAKEDRPVVLSDFKNTPFIFISDTDDNKDSEQSALVSVMNAGLIPKDYIWADSVGALELMVNSGMGVGVVSPTAQLTTNDDILSSPLNDNNSHLGVSLCWKPENKSPVLMNFIETIRRKCSE